MVLLIGLALITAGCSLAWLPLGPIVLGTLLLGGLTWTRLRSVDVAQQPKPVEEANSND